VKDQAHDQIGYRIAVAAIGIALIVALAGLCVIVAVGEGTEVPKELWTTVSALGGGLLGLLAPSPTSTTVKSEGQGQEGVDEGAKEEKGAAAQLSLREAAQRNRSVVILLIVFGVAVLLGAVSDSTQFQALAAASGAALIGLLAPSPATDEG
jgi:hypothetical protein